MIISPSIASFDVLNFAEEAKYIDENFDHIHIDIEDGMAVNGISFGFKVARGVMSMVKAKASIHLEVMHPLDYLDDVMSCQPYVVFIQADVLDDPLLVVKEFKKRGLNVGLAVGDKDLDKDYQDIFTITKDVLVSTAYHDDEKQIYQKVLEDYAHSLFEKYGLRVWLDGGVTLEKYEELKNSDFYAAVMGRAVYQNKELFKKQKESL